MKRPRSIVLKALFCLTALLGSILLYSSGPIVKSNQKKVELLKKLQSTAEEEVPHGSEDGDVCIDFFFTTNCREGVHETITMPMVNLDTSFDLESSIAIKDPYFDLFAPPPEA